MSQITTQNKNKGEIKQDHLSDYNQQNKTTLMTTIVYGGDNEHNKKISICLMLDCKLGNLELELHCIQCLMKASKAFFPTW